ncbi:hypothetical protein JXM83_07475 [Candidatus Woesearchaeota archaeon]|nr:hypothetical protein [Candidatus Woesearchaeota archaeon]
MVENLKKGYDEFLISEITKYIIQELKSGNNLNDVKNALLNAGHDKTAIELAVKELEKHGFKKFSTKKINNDAEKELIEALEIFVEDQIKHGTSIARIKKVLKDYGHAEHLIEKAISNYKQKPKSQFPKRTLKLPTTETLLKEHVLLTSIVSLLIIIVVASASIDENPLLVFGGFIPTLATILVSYTYIEILESKIYTIPFVIVLGYFAISFIVPAMQKMEIGSLSIINIILSLIIVTLFHASQKNSN